ncbi:hypothetical protein ACHAXS_007571 [Conticribra weissflogii]
MMRKSSLRARWLVLSLACVVMTGSYYAYDIPSALHQQLQDYMPHSPHFETQFNLLYTVYSIPNVILPLFGGNIVDRCGAPACLALFAFFTLLGSSFLSIGVASKSWYIMYIGRFVFGLGGESLCVAQSTILSEWFEGKEVAFAMGVGLAVSRSGSILNNVWSPKIANGARIETAFWLGAVLTGMSLILAGIITVVDRRAVKKIWKRRRRLDDGLESLSVALLEDAERASGQTAGGDTDENGDKKKSMRQRERESNGNNVTATAVTTAETPCVASAESEVHIKDVMKFGPLFWLLAISCFVIYGCVLPFNNVASGILLERNLFTSPPGNCRLQSSDECTLGYLQEGTNPSLDSNGDGSICHVAPTQAPLLPSSVNFTTVDSDKSHAWEETSYIYSDLGPHNVDCGDPFWLEGCTKDYCTKQNDATERAGEIMSIPYFISALSSPLLGHVVDKIGRRAQLATLASSILLAVHLTMALSDSSPIAPMVGQGIAYSLYASVLWPSVPLTVAKQFTGTAFGVITSIQNIGLAIFPLIVAAVYNASGGKYIPNVEFFFVSCAVAGVVVGVFMIRLDRRTGGKLYAASGEGGDSVVLNGNEGDVIVGRNPVGSVRDREAGLFDDVEDEMYFSPLI